MKKKLNFTFILILIWVISMGQTSQIERENLKRRQQSGAIHLTKYQELAVELAKVEPLLEELTILLPINSSGYLYYKNVEEFSGLSKKIIFDRILEFGAKNFGSLDAVLHYSDLNSGKIVLKGYTKINHLADFRKYLFWKTVILEEVRSRDCKFTMTFTIKDNKLKTEIDNISFEYYVDGYISSNVYVPSKSFVFQYDRIFPITNNDDFIDWKPDLDLLKRSHYNLKGLIGSINTYINDYEQDYKF